MLRILLALSVMVLYSFSGADPERESVSVKEGDSVSLHADIKMNLKDRFKWYFNGICIAQITGDLSFICTDVQCNEGTEGFGNRLKLDHQTGSLTIMNTRNTDSGEYQLQIFTSRSGDSLKIFNVTVYGTGVSVMEGDSVTLNTGVTTNQQDRIRWYCNNTRIAQINGDRSKICTDVQCNEGTERFRDRVKLDHQTGSLTIMNINITDAGEYLLQISSSKIEKMFNIAVRDVPATVKNETKMMREGESVTLGPGETKNPNDVMMWFFIDGITGDQSKISTDDQCDERFRDRLELDHQTGSLTIMNTRITDSGVYQLLITSSRNDFSIGRFKNFSVSVTAAGLSAGAVAGIVVVLLLVSAASVAAGIYYRKRHTRDGNRIPQNHEDQNPANGTSPNHTDPLMKNVDNVTSPNP